MKIIVTGGSGKLGRAVIASLATEGHDLWNLDRVPSPTPRPNVTDTFTETTDASEVFEAIAGLESRPTPADVIIHLAGIPGPTRAADSKIFHDNFISTANVFAAARRLQTPKIIWASSETLLGDPFDVAPDYLPVDEIPSRPRPAFSPYSLAKHLEEEIATVMAGWNPTLSMTGLRFSNVMDDRDYPGFEAWQDDPDARSWNLWSYIDAADAAEAVRLTLHHENIGFDTFVIAAADTVMRRPNAELIAGRFDDVEVHGDISGRRSLLNSAKAGQVLGWEARRSWLDTPHA